jgi:hypothetical protein
MENITPYNEFLNEKNGFNPWRDKGLNDPKDLFKKQLVTSRPEDRPQVGSKYWDWELIQKKAHIEKFVEMGVPDNEMFDFFIACEPTKEEIRKAKSTTEEAIKNMAAGIKELRELALGYKTGDKPNFKELLPKYEKEYAAKVKSAEEVIEKLKRKM